MSEEVLLHPFVTVDVALFAMDGDRLKVLLVQRSEEPEIRRWALPGGAIQPKIDADLESAARRVLREKVNLEIAHLEEVCSFSGRDRDPRDWSVSMLYFALLPKDKLRPDALSKVSAWDWVDPAHPGHRMAFDHEQQLGAALAKLRTKVDRHALPLHLLPAQFTLTELQRTCEAILGKDLDKSVFRRRLKTVDDLVEVPGQFERGNQRPAQVYEARPGFEFMVRERT